MTFPKHYHAPFVSKAKPKLPDVAPVRLSFHEIVGSDVDETSVPLGDATDAADMGLGDLFQFQQQPKCAMEAPSSMPTKCNGLHLDSTQAQENSTNLNQSVHSFVNGIRNISCHGEELQAPNDRNFHHVPLPQIPGLGLAPRRISADGRNAPVPRSPRPQRRVTPDPPSASDLRRLLDGNSRAALLLSWNGANLSHEPDERAYREAARKLARSMRRTELSRRQLAMMGVPTPRPRRHRPVPSDAQRRLRRRVAGLPGAPRTVSLAPGPAMADFFAGRRSTLTDGLEDSRRRLRMYAGLIGSC